MTISHLFMYNQFSKPPKKVCVLGHEWILCKVIDLKTTKKFWDYVRSDSSNELLFKTYLISMPYLRVTAYTMQL